MMEQTRGVQTQETVEASSYRGGHLRTGTSPRFNLSFVAGNILVKEVNWLGDLVISLPALRAVRAAFPTAKLAVLVKEELAGFFDGFEWIDEVIPYSIAPGARGWAGHWKIISEIRTRRFDLSILFPNSFQSALWITLAGVPRRVGYATDKRAFMLTHSAAPAADALERHQAHYWLGMLRDTLGIMPVPDAEQYSLEIGGKELNKMRRWLAGKRLHREAPIIAIAPAAAYGPAKEWPLVRYVALIDLLADRYGAECVLVGAPSERPKCEQVAATAGGDTIVAAGETGIGELIALLSLCDGFAGNDSGAMHLAGALGIPTVGIFGSTNPVRTGPTGARAGFIYHRLECSPCLERTCRFNHYNCLRQVTPEEIAGALHVLGAFAKSSTNG
jgi:heptosyltransferase-2